MQTIAILRRSFHQLGRRLGLLEALRLFCPTMAPADLVETDLFEGLPAR